MVVSERWVVRGMDCAHCASRLEKTLARMEGVKRVSVNFATGALLLEYDVTKVLPADLKRAIAALGYSAEARSGTNPSYVHDGDAGNCKDHSEHDCHCGLEGHSHVHSHSDSDDHDYDRSHTGSHVHAHGHSHDHGHSHGEGGVRELLPPLAGAIGIGLGFLLRRLGYDWYWAVYLGASLVAGYPVARAGLRSLLAGMGADINLLTTVAGIGALFLGEWAEGAAVLTLFSVGEYLEGMASDRARRSIREALDLAPPTARVRQGEVIAVIPAGDLVPGDTVIILPGERIPADGRVILGDSSVNEAPITGESVPVEKARGSEVYAGTLNGEGSLEIIVTREAHDTTLARIVSMVEDAQSKKAVSERLIDRFARYWTPAMILLSVLVAFGVPFATGAEIRPWIYRGLTVLIVSCPCSLVISTPVTVVAAIARAARNGVLIKGGVHLEDLGRVRAIAFDKTGTVTKGKMSVETVLPAAPDVTEEQVLFTAASVESRSEHPLAKAILEHAEAKGVTYETGEHFVSLRGRGAKAKVSGRNAYVGSEALFLELGVSVPDDIREKVLELRRMGQTAVLAGNGERVLGVIGISDQVRNEAKEALARLSDMGLHVTVHTGDDEVTAAAVAEKIGVKSFKANLLPDQKQEALREVRKAYGRTAMVGDGVNDAPSLAEASPGIAMGQGADVALETADVALLKDDLRKIAWAVELGRASRALIFQNIAFSIALKSVALVAVLGGVLPIWLAVMADSGAAVIVTLNGLRILGFKKENN